MIFKIIFGHWAESFGLLLENHQRVCQNRFPIVHSSILKEQKFFENLEFFSDLTDVWKKTLHPCSEFVSAKFLKAAFYVSCWIFSEIVFSRKKLRYFNRSRTMSQIFRNFAGILLAGLSHVAPAFYLSLGTVWVEHFFEKPFLFQSFQTIRVKFFAFFQKNLRGFVKTTF